jgi:hypothetical protein
LSFERKTYEIAAAGGLVRVALRTAAEISKLDQKHRQGGELDAYQFSRELFAASVEGWSGGLFEGHECTPAEVSSLYDVHTDLANEILGKAQEARRKDRAALLGN